MDKIYYKELIEKYFDGNITDAEIKELSDWIKNDRHLQNWWEEEFSKSDAGINPVHKPPHRLFSESPLL